jgi:hypothetical protein
MRQALAILVATTLAGCANVPDSVAPYGECTLPVTRNAGMGVTSPGCAAWTFGPTPKQRADFDKRKEQRLQ